MFHHIHLYLAKWSNMNVCFDKIFIEAQRDRDANMFAQDRAQLAGVHMQVYDRIQWSFLFSHKWSNMTFEHILDP